MKSRGLALPDFGDTLAMTFSVNVSPRMRQQKDWFKDLTRYRYRTPSKNSGWPDRDAHSLHVLASIRADRVG